MNNEKYLPLGTIVMLNGGKKRVMITGYCCKTKTSEQIYDYTGCLYPEGYISSDKMLVFNHQDIEKIDSFGYIDEEFNNFKNLLNKLNQ